MKLYLTIIKKVQIHLIWFSVVLFLVFMPSFLVIQSDTINQSIKSFLFTISLLSVSLVMSIRPLANIFSGNRYIRPLVILRKSFGVFSASIIIGLVLSKIIATGGQYIYAPFDGAYWSLDRYALLAHLGDISALILLLTSNNFSKFLLKNWWKRIQKLSYVYFYSGALYEYLVFQQSLALWMIMLVSMLVLLAFIKNKKHQAYENYKN